MLLSVVMLDGAYNGVGAPLVNEHGHIICCSGREACSGLGYLCRRQRLQHTVPS